ncbi:MAG: kelch repeat-containing protein, partial [Thermoplasmata archaeon]
MRNIAYCVSTLLLLSVVLGLVSEEGAGQDVSTWTDVNPAPRPSPRFYHAMAYDSESDRVVLFGGFVVTDPPEAEVGDDTWAYDVNTDTWTNMDPVSRPSPRFYHAMAYDSESDRVVLFGGSTATTFSDETWTYDLNTNTWTDVTPAVGPSGRANQGMAYDAESDR